MVRSRLPLASLLSLFGALLMPSPALLTDLSPTSVNDPEVQEPLAFAVEQYNQKRSDSGNYFKVQSLKKMVIRDRYWMEYIFMVDFVLTTCQKKFRRLTFRKIQECERLPGNHEEPVCLVEVAKLFAPPPEMLYDTVLCDWPGFL